MQIRIDEGLLGCTDIVAAILEDRSCERFHRSFSIGLRFIIMISNAKVIRAALIN